MHSINIFCKIIYVTHTNNTHNDKIKTILGYYSWLVGQLTKVDWLLCLFHGDNIQHLGQPVRHSDTIYIIYYIRKM